MNVDSTVFEFVKEGESVSLGESGEILCTDLINYAMPLLRYELGDVGVPVEDCCSCGIRLPLMKRLTGRTDDFLIALDGRRISPLIFGPFPFENMERIRQFRVIQERKDRIRFQLVLKGTFPNSEQIFGEAEKKLERLLGIGIHVDFDILDSIQRDPCGKLRKVISRVSPR